MDYSYPRQDKKSRPVATIDKQEESRQIRKQNNKLSYEIVFLLSMDKLESKK